MQATPRSRVLSLTDAALDAAADPAVPVSALLGRAIRAARAAANAEALVSFMLDAHGLKDNSWRTTVEAELSRHLPRGQLEASWSRSVERWMKLRTEDVDGRDMFFGISVGEIEAKMVDIAQMLERPGISDHADAQGRLAIARNRQLLARIRLLIVDQLTHIEQQALVDGLVETVFDRYRAQVDAFLLEYAPGALEQLAAAYRRRDETDKEALSHALTSCRRALKTLADELYPPKTDPIISADGISHRLTDDKFLNRLLQYASENAPRSKSARLTNAAVRDLADRLEALNDLASKGVHATASEGEVDQCIVQTYFVIGDILRMRADELAAHAPSIP